MTPDDKVKVLDFGLAKAFADDEAEVNAANSPTLSMQATQQGVILGTAGYMSPEQTRGREVDKRTDIWAFGCVVYEMLVGKPVFSGEDVTDILAAVVRAEPEWGALPGGLHSRLREILRDCLEKKPNDRTRDIGDVQLGIRKVLADPGGVLVRPVAAVASLGRQSKLPWIAATLVIAAVTGFGVWAFRRPDPPLPVRLTAVHPGPEYVGGNPFNSNIELSPDGRRVAYVASLSPGNINLLPLYVRALDQLEPTLLSDSSRSPFFSPDGEWDLSTTAS